jgi:NAD(P)-dependent dehydrogenase (short-subunit alcohol dehydrogenase family)
MLLVNNAGALPGGVHTPSNLAAITDEAWDRMHNLNLKGAFLCSREVAPRMQANKYGKIVNISSIGAEVPMQRVGTPDDIAGAALFLASGLARTGWRSTHSGSWSGRSADVWVVSLTGRPDAARHYVEPAG